jgi:elongator complex protein 6
MASQIPRLLESCLSLPPETSQIVLTGILGASTNWLTLRYLYSLLRPATAAATATRLDRDGDADPGAGGGEHVKVLLVSFMRDHAFWKEGAGRLVCLPLSRCLQQAAFSHAPTNNTQTHWARI